MKHISALFNAGKLCPTTLALLFHWSLWRIVNMTLRHFPFYPEMQFLRIDFLCPAKLYPHTTMLSAPSSSPSSHNWASSSEMTGTQTNLAGPRPPVAWFVERKYIWNVLLISWRLFILVNFPGGSDGKESTSNEGDLGSIPGGEDLLYEYMAIHSRILAWRITSTEEPGGL